MAGLFSDNKTLRYACDRCHSQKLRCPRPIEPEKTNLEEPCSRCRKAGVVCVVSLRGKVGRPSKATKKKQQFRSICQTPKPVSPQFDASAPLNPDEAWLTSVKDRVVDRIDLSGDSKATNTSPWTAEGSSSTTSRNPSDATPFPDIQMGPGLGHMSCEPFVMDFDTESNLLPFCFPSMADIAASGDSLPDFDGEFKTTTATLNGIVEGNSPPNLGTPSGMLSPSDVLSMSPPSVTADVSMAQAIPAKAQNSPEEMAMPESSSTACHQKLSILNLRISAFMAKRGPQSDNSSLVLKDVVGFSGELIGTARQSMPQFGVLLLSSPKVSIGSRTHSTSSWSDNGDSSADSVLAFGALPQSAPESAVIFLLLVCYTQILYLFEVTINCLWKQHCERIRLSPPNEDSSGTVSTLLEASLAIHTVTYLLSRIHRALAVGERSGKQEDETGTDDPQSWSRSFVGGKKLEDGLLGRAFGEIMEREQWLMRRSQYLQQHINSSHI